MAMAMAMAMAIGTANAFSRKCTLLLVVLLPLTLLQAPSPWHGVDASTILRYDVRTPGPNTSFCGDVKPCRVSSSSAPLTGQTSIGEVGRDINTSLVRTGTAAFFWGVVPGAMVYAACDGRNASLTAIVSHAWGQTVPQEMQLEVLSSKGCLLNQDSSGTEAVLTDPSSLSSGRTVIVLCPENAGNSGCAVYLTGSDVSALYTPVEASAPSPTAGPPVAGGGQGRRLLALIMSNRRQLQGTGCSLNGSVTPGVITGAVTGLFVATAKCLFVPFCIVNTVVVDAVLGGVENCVFDAIHGWALWKILAIVASGVFAIIILGVALWSIAAACRDD